MASIRKLPSGKYQCQIRVKGKKALNKSFYTKDEAKLWAAEKEKVLKATQGYTSITHDLSLDETIQDIGVRYCATVLKGRPAARETELRVDRIGKHFPQPLAEITKWDVNNYRLMRLESVSGTTCRDELLLISRLFKWVRRELLIDLPNPCEEVALPKASKPRDKVVTPEEMKQLLSALTPIMRTVIELAYETAMRRSELLKLTPQCLHLEERYLDVIDGKTGCRSVPLSTRAIELLSGAARDSSGPEVKLFPLSGASVTQALRRVRRELGLSEDIRVHQLRHTRISLVARKGFNNAQIMAVSGHKDVRSVQRYSHLNAVDVAHLLD